MGLEVKIPKNNLLVDTLETPFIIGYDNTDGEPIYRIIIDLIPYTTGVSGNAQLSINPIISLIEDKSICINSKVVTEKANERKFCTDAVFLSFFGSGLGSTLGIVNNTIINYISNWSELTTCKLIYDYKN